MSALWIRPDQPCFKKYRNSRFYLCDKQGSDPEMSLYQLEPSHKGKNCETCGSYMVWKNFRGRSYPGCGNRDCRRIKEKASTKQTTKQENQDLTSEAVDNDEKMSDMSSATVIGAGLAGCGRLATSQSRIAVLLLDMKPERFSPAHRFSVLPNWCAAILFALCVWKTRSDCSRRKCGGSIL